MYTIFLVSYLFTLIYLFIWIRKYDISFFAMCGNLVYLYPGVLGFYPKFGTPGAVDEISETTYLLLTIILILPFILYLFPPRRYVLKRQLNLTSLGHPSYIITIIFFIVNVFTIDFTSNLDKRTLMDSMTIFYNLWVYLNIISIVLNSNNRFRLLILFTLLFFDVLFFSMRIHIIYGLYALIAVRVLNKEVKRTVYNSLLLLCGVLIGSLLLIFKSIILPIRQGDWQLVLERITHKETYLYWLARAEPFNQIAIIDKVVQSGFQAPVEHVLGSFLVVIPYWNKAISLPVRFHDYFHTELFPSIPIVGSIANSPWAQAYSVGAASGFLILALIYLLVLVFFRNMSYSSKNSIIWVSLLLFPICFYWHRNDLYFTFNIIKRIFLGFFLLYFIVNIIKNKYVRNSTYKY